MFGQIADVVPGMNYGSDTVPDRGMARRTSRVLMARRRLSVQVPDRNARAWCRTCGFTTPRRWQEQLRGASTLRRPSKLTQPRSTGWLLLWPIPARRRTRSAERASTQRRDSCLWLKFRRTQRRIPTSRDPSSMYSMWVASDWRPRRTSGFSSRSNGPRAAPWQPAPINRLLARRTILRSAEKKGVFSAPGRSAQRSGDRTPNSRGPVRP